MPETLKLSITDLVRLSCQSGDLISAGPAGPSALQGQRAHQKLQARKTAQQQSEVKLEASVERQGYSVRLGGRIDLLDEQSEPQQLIEIKSCLAPPDKLPQSQTDMHWAQLKLYGYCKLLNEPDLTRLDLSLHWINIHSDELTEETQTHERAALEQFSLAALDRYLKLHDQVQQHRLKAIATAQALAFPFDNFRSGQREMAAAVYRCIRDKERLLSEAPTGIGKTISTLFPAIKALGEGHTQQIFYLTAKNSGRQAADDTLEHMRSQGLHLSSVQLSAKQQLCHCSNGSCERDEEGHCPLTLGFFDRLPAAREQLIQRMHIDSKALDEAAHQHQLCPFELSLQLIPWVDVVICDYNYVFDPLVRLSLITENARQITLLVDEAHNLIDRARSMYSADLSRRESRIAAKAADSSPALAKQFTALARALKRISHDQKTTVALDEPPLSISRAVAKAVQEFSVALEGKPLPAELSDWFKTLYRYTVIDELFGAHHRALMSCETDDQLLRLACLNATDRLAQSFKAFHSVVCFSATLSPPDVYRSNLGLADSSKQQRLASPFLPQQLACILCDDIDTRFAARERSTPALISVIAQLYQARPGNYLVFFPSYAYLRNVLEAFVVAHPDIATRAQARNSDPDERQAFRDTFSAAGRCVGFAILGGIYSEGVDFVGDSLLGAVIAGTGLSAVSTEQRLVQADYEQQGLDGFDHAFKYPGMTRVLQAAGRVIRSESDRGVIILADRRFRQMFYRELMPPLWNMQAVHNHADISTKLDLFWNE